MYQHISVKLQKCAVAQVDQYVSTDDDSVDNDALQCKVSWFTCIKSILLTLKVLVATIDAQWEGMGGCRVGEVRAGTTSPVPDHKGFKLQ